jgi:hypothetical protein
MFDKPTERRDYLKLTGAGIAGTALGIAAPAQAEAAKTRSNPAIGNTFDVRT